MKSKKDIKQVDSITLSNLRTDEDFGFLERVVAITSLLTISADKEHIDAFKAAVDKFDDVLKRSQALAETKMLKEADKIADDTWRGLRMQTEAMTRFPEPTTQAIAQKVEAIIKRFGSLNAMSYDEEYANMKNLIEELNSLPEADLIKVGLKSWIDALEVAYTNYMEATIKKHTAAGSRTKGEVQACRKAADQAFYELVFRINCGAGYNDDAPYAPFIDTLNAQIAERKATLAARKTNAAKKNSVLKEFK